MNATANFAHDESERNRAKHREIARRYAWQARQRKAALPKGDAHLILIVRLRNLETLFRDSYGRFLPDDDAGREDLLIAAHTIAGLGGDVAAHITAWAAANAPWASTSEVEALTRRVLAKPIKWKADTLGWRLKLTDDRRTRLGITTIGAVDVSKAERAARRKRENCDDQRARDTADRRAAGRKTRAEYEATSASRTKPWLDAGFKTRRTWERHGKPAPAVASASCRKLSGHQGSISKWGKRTCDTAQPSAATPGPTPGPRSVETGTADQMRSRPGRCHTVEPVHAATISGQEACPLKTAHDGDLIDPMTRRKRTTAHGNAWKAVRDAVFAANARRKRLARAKRVKPDAVLIAEAIAQGRITRCPPSTAFDHERSPYLTATWQAENGDAPRDAARRTLGGRSQKAGRAAPGISPATTT